MKHIKKYGKSQTFKVKLNNKIHQVYLKDVQLNVARPKDFIHFSLLKITASDTMTSLIPIHVINKGEVERKGLLLQLAISAVEVEYPVGSGVNNIEIDVANLEVGDAICIKDLIVPEGYKIQIDADSVVANVTHPKVQEEEESVEPSKVDVIGEKADEEDKA